MNNSLVKYKNVQKKNQLVLLSQGTTGKYIAAYAVKLANKLDNIDIIYKLHPGEYNGWKELYPELYIASLNGLLTVVMGESSTLYNLLSESRWQIGVNSTALFEGLAFKCRTFILKCTGYEYLMDLIDSGIVKLVGLDESIVNDLFNVDVIEEPEIFFKKNHEKAIKEAVKYVIDRT